MSPSKHQKNYDKPLQVIRIQANQFESNSAETFQFGQKFVDILHFDSGLANRWFFDGQSLDTSTDLDTEIGWRFLFDRLLFRFLQRQLAKKE